MPRAFATASLLVLVLAACSPPTPDRTPREPFGYIPTAVTSAQPEWIPFSIRAGKPAPFDARERRLAELRRLTFGDGDSAEVSWSPDGRKLMFQSTREGRSCEQVYVMDLGSGEVKRVSTGGARAVGGSFLYPRGEEILYASTLAAGTGCPARPEHAQGDPFQIYEARSDGSDRRLLIGAKGTNAEAAASPDGARLVFTSTRDGNPELYSARGDGSDIRRLTHGGGHDGGAVFSPDGARITWHASRPKGGDVVEIMVAGAQGQNARAVTRNGKTNLAPSFLRDARRIIFSSNWDAAPSQGFDLYIVDPEAPPTMEGTPPLERVTFHEGFDGFPVFSPDGEHLAFVSSRFGSKPEEMNLFVARWVD